MVEGQGGGCDGDENSPVFHQKCLRIAQRSHEKGNCLIEDGNGCGFDGGGKWNGIVMMNIGIRYVVVGNRKQIL